MATRRLRGATWVSCALARATLAACTTCCPIQLPASASPPTHGTSAATPPMSLVTPPPRCGKITRLRTFSSRITVACADPPSSPW